MPADGRRAVDRQQPGSAGTASSATGSSESAEIEADVLGQRGERLRRRLGDHAADDAGDVRDRRAGTVGITVAARRPRPGRRRRRRAPADRRAAAGHKRAGRQIDVAQHAALHRARPRPADRPGPARRCRPDRPPRRGSPAPTPSAAPSVTSNLTDSSAETSAGCVCASGRAPPPSQAARCRRAAPGTRRAPESGVRKAAYWTQHYTALRGAWRIRGRAPESSPGRVACVIHGMYLRLRCLASPPRKFASWRLLARLRLSEQEVARMTDDLGGDSRLCRCPACARHAARRADDARGSVRLSAAGGRRRSRRCPSTRRWRTPRAARPASSRFHASSPGPGRDAEGGVQ